MEVTVFGTPLSELIGQMLLSLFFVLLTFKVLFGSPKKMTYNPFLYAFTMSFLVGIVLFLILAYLAPYDLYGIAKGAFNLPIFQS
jgi:hypothetical protein